MSLADKLKQKEEQKNDGKVVFWKPDPGEIIEGEITEIGTMTTHEKEDSPYIQIRANENGQNREYIVFKNPVLQRLLDEENAEVGDQIAIKFAGLKKSKKNPKRSYKDYVVAVEKTTEIADEIE
jgi:dihydroorotate dehydrogenase